MTDGVTDEQFEGAIEDAKSEGNLTRANVVRKVKSQAGPQTRTARADLIADLAAEGYSSRQMPAKVGVAEQSVPELAELTAEVRRLRAARDERSGSAQPNS